MIAKNDVAKVYDTILSIPGMNDEMKISLKISRKNLLLLNKLIERGLNGKESNDQSISVLDTVPKETLLELSNISAELLDKAGLTEMNEKLKAF
ncbi:MAG: hypothetical protein GXC73_13045 [Chitinophagaceae bacterium]|nr:hypothetical protein [Chitinophagaceae bacterium]